MPWQHLRVSLPNPVAVLGTSSLLFSNDPLCSSMGSVLQPVCR